jgi:hypothetical protein
MRAIQSQESVTTCSRFQGTAPAVDSGNKHKTALASTRIMVLHHRRTMALSAGLARRLGGYFGNAAIPRLFCC